MAILVNAAGNPEPNTEILRRLAQIHPDLGLQFSAVTPQHWMVTMQWPKHDRRWELVQQQQISGDATYTILGWLPLDCPVDQAPSFIARYLRTATEESVRNLTQYVERYNADAPQAAVDEALHAIFEGGDPSAAAPKVKGRRTSHKKV